jgi:hypothetical protein
MLRHHMGPEYKLFSHFAGMTVVVDSAGDVWTCEGTVDLSREFRSTEVNILAKLKDARPHPAPTMAQ